jgi:hypothetical protein
MDAQLQQIIELQKEQNQLLKKYLWRFRFSLMALLSLTTAICIYLGIVTHVYYSSTQSVPIAPSGLPSPTPPIRRVYVPPREPPPTLEGTGEQRINAF